jgi:hypothetical protein
MDKDRDLLPWIMGGLSMAAIAAAITIASASRTAPRTLVTPSPDTSSTRPVAQAAPVPALTPLVPAPASPEAQIQTVTVTPPTESENQIWECTIDGQKTFSNKPCGQHALRREIGPINTMDATPVLSRGGAYPPEPGYQPDYPYPGAADYSGAQDSSDSSYPVLVGIPIYERGRLDHAHHPHAHTRGAPSR